MRSQIHRNRNSGQSLLEALVAIGIIVTSISSALTLITSAISAEKESEFAVTAGNLAREVVEVTHGIRDTNWLMRRVWDDGLFDVGSDYTAASSFDPTANLWQLDFSPDSTADDAARVYRYTTGLGGSTVGLFVQAVVQPDDTIATPFRRLVTLDPICDDGSIKQSGADCGLAKKIGVRVSAEVLWNSAGRPHRLVVEERLYDWR